jgi:hypothetical protein
MIPSGFCLPGRRGRLPRQGTHGASGPCTLAPCPICRTAEQLDVRHYDSGWITSNVPAATIYFGLGAGEALHEG